MSNKIINGALAVISVNSKVCGIFDSCNWSVNYGTEPAFICGRSSPAEIAVTSQEAVSIQCSGFRIIDQGVHLLPNAPRLQDLLNLQDITISVRDRTSGKNLVTVTGCKVSGYTGGVQSKALSRISINYIGLSVSDESGDQAEAKGATELP